MDRLAVTFTLKDLEQRLRDDAKARGSAFGQVFHEADLDGYHFYMADSSFGYGPVFSVTGNGRQCGFAREGDEWEPVYVGTTVEDLEWILPLAARAPWLYRLDRFYS